MDRRAERPDCLSWHPDIMRPIAGSFGHIWARFRRQYRRASCELSSRPKVCALATTCLHATIIARPWAECADALAWHRVCLLFRSVGASCVRKCRPNEWPPVGAACQRVKVAHLGARTCSELVLDTSARGSVGRCSLLVERDGSSVGGVAVEAPRRVQREQMQRRRWLQLAALFVLSAGGRASPRAACISPASALLCSALAHFLRSWARFGAQLRRTSQPSPFIGPLRTASSKPPVCTQTKRN